MEIASDVEKAFKEPIFKGNFNSRNSKSSYRYPRKGETIFWVKPNGKPIDFLNVNNSSCRGPRPGQTAAEMDGVADSQNRGVKK